MKRLMLIFIAVSVFLSGGTALALEFSADIVSSGKGGSFQGKMFVTDQKIRTEMPGAVSIVRMDQNIAWVIMPGQKMYMEQPIDPKMISGAAEKMPGEIERKMLGEETIDGRPAIKYHIAYESNGMRESILQWSDKASSVPVKVTAEDGSWSMEYKNLKIGPQDPSLFEVPQGYTKFAMPDVKDMMGMNQ